MRGGVYNVSVRVYISYCATYVHNIEGRANYAFNVKRADYGRVYKLCMWVLIIILDSIRCQQCQYDTLTPVGDNIVNIHSTHVLPRRIEVVAAYMRV